MEHADDVCEQGLPHPKLYLMQQVNHKKWIHIKAWETGHEGVLGPISISNTGGSVDGLAYINCHS